MNLKRIFAFLTVAVMLTASAACMFGADVHADSASDGELKEGMHIHLKDLKQDGSAESTNKDLTNLFGLKYEPEMFEANGMKEQIAFAFLLPGFNMKDLEFDATKMQDMINSISIAVKSVDIDVSHYVSDDKTEMKLKGSAKAEVEMATCDIYLSNGNEQNVVVSPDARGMDMDFTKLTFKGSYAEKMREDLKDVKWGSKISVKISGKVEIYAESTFKLAKADDGHSYYVNGGFLIPPTGLKSDKIDFSIPVTKLEGECTPKAEVKFGDHNVTVEDTLTLFLNTETERDYPSTDSKKVTDGTVYRDKFKNARLSVELSNTYNGNANGDALLIDLTDILKQLCNGQYYKIDGTKKNIDWFADDYMLYTNLIGGEENVRYGSIIIGKDKLTKTDEEAKVLMRTYGHVSEGKDGFSYSYDDANASTTDVMNSIEGKAASTNNSRAVIGIVIAVIVVLALIALWYFKFRPETAANGPATKAPEHTEPKVQEDMQEPKQP